MLLAKDWRASIMKIPYKSHWLKSILNISNRSFIIRFATFSFYAFCSPMLTIFVRWKFPQTNCEKCIFILDDLSCDFNGKCPWGYGGELDLFMQMLDSLSSTFLVRRALIECLPASRMVLTLHNSKCFLSAWIPMHIGNQNPCINAGLLPA